MRNKGLGKQKVPGKTRGAAKSKGLKAARSVPQSTTPKNTAKQLRS